jgi:hypothetical protein
MKRLRRYRPSPALVVASIALAIALGGTSYAAVVLPRNSVGTPQLKNNAVTSLKVLNGSLRAADFAAGQIPAGPPGPQGPAGPSGPAGASASSNWGVVAANGTLARGSGVVTTSKLSGAGSYSVRFNRPVNACAWIAVIGSTAAGTNKGFATTELTSASVTDTITVNTFSAAGDPADRPFHVAVFCPA